jgi:starch synthase
MISGKRMALSQKRLFRYNKRKPTHTHMNTLSPTADASIARKYGAKSLEYKVQNKVALQEELGWPAEAKRPVICLPLGMTDQLGGAVLMELIPGLLSLPVEILIRGKGSSTYGALFTKLAKEYGHRIAIIPDEDEALRKMFAASDMALFLADPSGSPELEYCLSYGTVPVSMESKRLESYNPNQEKGDAFLFEKQTVWHAFGAIVRALETFRFPFDWRTIQRNAMEKTEKA